MSVYSNRSSDSPQERTAYAGAVLDLLGGRDPIAVLKDTPAGLASAIAGLAPDRLRSS